MYIKLSNSKSRTWKGAEVYPALVCIAAGMGALGGALVFSSYDFDIVIGMFYGVVLSIPTWLILVRYLVPPTWRRTLCIGLLSPFVGSLFMLCLPIGILVGAGYFTFPIGVLTAFLIRRAVIKASVQDEYPACHGCGYNLTGNVSGRCPECGRAVKVERTLQTLQRKEKGSDKIG